MPGVTKEQIQAAREADLFAYLQFHEPGVLKRDGPNYRHKEHDSLVYVTGKRYWYKDPGANTIEVSGRIRSFERYARKHQVRYHIEKELGTDPPKWTVYFKANQADALTAAFKEYTQKDLARSTRPSLLSQLHKFKELAQALGRDRVKNKEHGGPER